MTTRFPLLFTPFKLGGHTLQSRIVVTGHATNFYDEEKLPTEAYAYYLRERARGGAGLLTLGSCSVHPSSTANFLNWDDRIVPRYRRIADLVHEFPVPVLTQLSHNGSRAAVSKLSGIPKRSLISSSYCLWSVVNALPRPRPLAARRRFCTAG